MVFVLNLVFNHWKLFPREREGALETALEYGAVAGPDLDSGSAASPDPAAST